MRLPRETECHKWRNLAYPPLATSLWRNSQQSASRQVCLGTIQTINGTKTLLWSGSGCLKGKLKEKEYKESQGLF